MTTFREFIGDLIREYFAVPRSTPEVQVAAANWQRAQLPRHLELLPGYQPGQYVHNYHNQLVTAIRQATMPNFTRIATTPLAARDIQYENTPPILEDDPDATEMRPAIKLHKATTTNTTQEIPAITAEITLLEIMRGPVSPHDTGEQAPVKVTAL